MTTGQRPDEPTAGLLLKATSANGGSFTGVVLGHNIVADLSTASPVLLDHGWWNNFRLSYQQRTPETAATYELNRERIAAAAKSFLEVRTVEMEQARTEQQQAANAHKKRKTPSQSVFIGCVTLFYKFLRFTLLPKDI